ncbi:MAG: sugar phosphate nucleotidyltransferase [Gemmatimonadota bacterium]
MILAAGLGTRLGDITRVIPKALVDVAGRTALEHVAGRLIDAGADRLIINVHHHAALIVDFVESLGGFGVEVAFSHERDAPLETGGGLLHAAGLFRRDAPFLLHNVDVLCDADLHALYAAHAAKGALATLAVHARETTRYLLFDGDRLIGRHDRHSVSGAEMFAAAEEPRRLAFAGIHVISPALLDLITERGAFSIIDVYMRLTAAGHRIVGHDIGSARWLEIGNAARLDAARRELGD